MTIPTLSESSGLLGGRRVATQADPDVLVECDRSSSSTRRILATIGIFTLAGAVLVHLSSSGGKENADGALLRAPRIGSKAPVVKGSPEVVVEEPPPPSDLPLLGKKHMKHHKEEEGETGDTTEGPTVPTKRCKWVVDLFTEKYAGKDEEELRQQYAVQSADSNVFYRATADIFWIDFVQGGWHDRIKFENIGIEAKQMDGTDLQPRSTWTWVTGDQHLSNFGAWRNRGGEVVFSVNDFDEAAIYDFQVDVLRIAVSVCSHAFTNGLDARSIHEVLHAFTDTYVETLEDYVGGDRELLYELTPKTASGSLKKFLTNLRDDKSGKGLVQKFTKTDKHGNRSFICDDNTRLVKISAEVEQAIR